jgi:endoglucanase
MTPSQPSILDWNDQHGVSYTAWSWIAGNCAAEPALITDYAGTPSNYGIGIKNHLLSLPH